jgi:hypothetical protein
MVMMRLAVIGLVLAAVLTTACGKSEEEKRAEEAAAQAQKAAEAATKAAESAGSTAAKGAEDFAAAMKGLATAMGGGKGADGKPVEPVSFRDLEPLLPSVSGWTMDKPRGERMTSPIPFSQTEASYQNGDSSVEVKIVDSAFNQMLVAPWAMFLSAGFSRETSDGYEKGTTVNGNPGFEKWQIEDKDGELNFVVAKRFLVTVDGNNIKDPKVMHEFASKIDTSKLASLK